MKILFSKKPSQLTTAVFAAWAAYKEDARPFSVTLVSRTAAGILRHIKYPRCLILVYIINYFCIKCKDFKAVYNISYKYL